MQKDKKTLVLGASPNPERYSYKAVERLKDYRYPVIPLGKRKGMIHDIKIETEPELFENIHTITLYLGAANQVGYYEYILQLKPKRIIFNPGTDNPELKVIAKENGIEVVEMCTLVLLSMNQY